MINDYYIAIESKRSFLRYAKIRNLDMLLLIKCAMIKSLVIDTTVTASARTSSSLSLGITILVLRIIVESARLEEQRVTQHVLRGEGLKVTQTNGATRGKKILC